MKLTQNIVVFSSLTLVILVVGSKTHGSYGKMFHFATMELYSSRSDPVTLKVLCSVPGNIDIISPGIGFYQTYSLIPNVTEIELADTLVRSNSIGVGKKGFVLTSTVEVMIFVFEGTQRKGHGKAMVLMPVSSIATKFVVQSYYPSWDSRKSQFIIVASENATDITISLMTTGNLTYNQITYRNGDAIDLTLNRLETFYLYHYKYDLSGSVIESSKPIAVFSGADCVDIPTQTGGCNIIESQLTPVQQWGNSFIIPPLYPASRYLLRVFAFYDKSNISIDSDTIAMNVTLNRGIFHDIILSTKPAIVYSNKPINVVLYGVSRSISDTEDSNPFMLTVPAVGQYAASPHRFPTLSYRHSLKKEIPFQNYVAIVLHTELKDLLLYNDASLDILEEHEIKLLANEYTVVIARLNNETLHVITTNNGSKPMGVFVYGMAHYEAYGFVVGSDFSHTDCRGFIAPANGSLSSMVVSHGSYLTVSCDDGYTLLGEHTILCFSGVLLGDIGECGADCRGLIAPAYGSLSSMVVSHGSYLTVSCNDGYTLLGEHTILCSSGVLLGDIGECKADCRGLIAPAYGSLSSMVVSHGSYLTVFCDDGYTLFGKRTLLCSSGALLGDIGECEADCRGLIAPAYGSLSSMVVSHGSYLTVSCDDGYTLSGEHTILCSSGALIGNIGVCEADCGGLFSPNHGSLSSTVVSHGSFLTVSCDDGFTLSGERILVCFSGSLSADVGSCEADCRVLVAPTHGSVSSLDVSHGSYVTVSCDAGYKLAGEQTLMCTSGSWSENIGTCQKAPVSGVTVQDGNLMLDGCANINANEGVPKTLTCIAGDYKFSVRFVWYIGNQVRQNHTSSTFTFMPETSEHNKHLYCVIIDLQGREVETSFKLTLYVMGRPAQPQTFVFTGTEGSNATFYWLAGYNGGFKQWFVLQYRLLGSRDWSNTSQIEEQIYDSDILTGIKQYRSQIDNLSPGEYQASLIAGNIKGEAPRLTMLDSTFQIKPSDMKCTCSPESSKYADEATIPIIGASLGFIIVILAGIIVFQCLQRKRQISKETAQPELNLADITQTENNTDPQNGYQDLRYVRQSASPTYATLDTNTGVR